MLITTTPSVEGRGIVRYLGIVNGETILGANLLRDLLASVRDIVGGRSRTYETALQQARESALEEMARRARLLGATAVVAVDLDYEVLGSSSGMLMVCASGTAVELAPLSPDPAADSAGR